MIIDLTGEVWLDERHEVSIDELAQLSGLSVAELELLIDNGALIPAHDAAPWTFRSSCIVSLRKASRLRAAFELDSSALALALVMLNRIHLLETQLEQMQAISLPERWQQ